MTDRGRTALYRYLDADGNPLYIGITGNLKERRTAHAQSRWALEAAAFTVEWFPTAQEAAAVETTAIRTERPQYNDADNYEIIHFEGASWPSLADNIRTRAVRLAELVQAEIDSGSWPANHRIPPAREMAAATCIGVGAARHAIELLQRQRYIYRYKSFGFFVWGRDA